MISLSKKQEQKFIVALAVISVIFTVKEMFNSLEDFQHYLLTVILCVSVFALMLMYMKNKKPSSHNSLTGIDYMKLNPHEFETFCARVLNAHGYQVMTTRKTNDGGKDLVGINDRNEQVFGEVKQYTKSNKIGRPYLQKLKGAMIDSNVQQGIFITTSDFTKEALTYAKRNNIKCINRYELDRLIRKS